MTDHKPLTFALHRISDALSARQQRHLSFLAEFTSDVHHMPGAENVVADTLSRPAALVLPASEGEVSLAHAGPRATRRMVTSRYSWPGCSKDVEVWSRDCQQCGRSKSGPQLKRPPLPINIPACSFTHVHVDIVGPLPVTSSGHSYLLTMMDRTTRWPEVVPLKTITVQEVADAFMQTWIARFGVPAVVTTDRGTQFSGSVEVFVHHAGS